MSKSSVVLGIFPNTLGFGYACVENQHILLEKGIASVRPICNKKLFDKICAYIEYYRPALVVAQNTKCLYSRQNKRTKRLINKIVSFCQEQGLPIHKYSREQVRNVFELFQATSKYQISKTLGTWFEELQPFVPKGQKIYQKEWYHMAVFDALALIVTHHYLAS